MNDYKVFVNGSETEIFYSNIFEPPYNEYKRMPYANFTCGGGSVIKIHSETKIESCMLRPLSYNMDFSFSEHEIIINMAEPKKFSVEINGSHRDNILIFANPKREYEIGGEVMRFCCGCEADGIVDISRDDVTVLFEEGAVFEGKFNIHDCKNIKILGCGVISMEKYPRLGLADEFMNALRITNCENVLIEDITVADSVNWTCKVSGCKGVHIDNLKIIGSRGNADGVDICGSKDVLVENVFTRTWDDSFVLKAFDTGDVENVVFRDSVLWNDFARPIEVGVEVRADSARNIRFENIDIIHSLTGYPLMGIHHGDRAVISDVEFRNIRIEDAPGAQLFDIRVTNSAWNQDPEMGRIENIKFTDIYLLEEQEVLPSMSRIQGFSPECNIKGVTFENINLLGKFASSPSECQLNVMDFVDDVKFIAPENGEKIQLINSKIEITKPFEYCEKCGKYKGTVRMSLENRGDRGHFAEAYLKISPANKADSALEISKNLAAGESAFSECELTLAPGKYMFAVQSSDVCIENSWMLTRLDLKLCNDIAASPEFVITDWYGNRSAPIKLAAKNGTLFVESSYEKLKLYACSPVPQASGEVMFSVEETDFGEVSAVLNGLHGAELAPQLRCPAEITFVFKNEPKVKEIVELEIAGKAEVPFGQLHLPDDCKNFWLEVEAETAETAGHRYPFTLFSSVKPAEIAHMFANVILND